MRACLSTRACLEAGFHGPPSAEACAGQLERRRLHPCGHLAMPACMPTALRCPCLLRKRGQAGTTCMPTACMPTRSHADWPQPAGRPSTTTDDNDGRRLARVQGPSHADLSHADFVGTWTLHVSTQRARSSTTLELTHELAHELTLTHTSARRRDELELSARVCLRLRKAARTHALECTLLGQELTHSHANARALRLSLSLSSRNARTAHNARKRTQLRTQTGEKALQKSRKRVRAGAK